MAVRSLSDIAAIEAVPLIERDLPESTYAALVASAKRTPNATALTFFRSADRLDDTHVWTYAKLVADVTRAANLFAALGVATDRPAAFVLPNLGNPLHHLGSRGRRRGACDQPDARAKPDRGLAALGQGFGPRHASAGL